MPSHGVRLSPTGQLEVVRSAPPEDLASLRSTATRLTRAAGAGVVDIVDLSDDGETLTLVLAFAGRPVTGPLGSSEVGRIGAAVAASLADLHLRELVHGDVCADHVLVDAGGEVRLCGLGARDATAPDDVAALGALLRTLLDVDDTSDEAWTLQTIADRSPVRRARRRHHLRRADDAQPSSPSPSPSRSRSSAPCGGRPRRARAETSRSMLPRG
jgi:tRNA A-37 threonylcarbamoyl transferase component Bud32